VSLLLPHEHMLGRVAQALDADLRAEIAFVGGCVTALHITDPVTRSAVRLTDDVDAILHVMGKGPWYQLMERLQRLGFRISLEDDITCRTRLRDGEGPELIVDFMPDDPAILGFSNRWYPDALKTASPYMLPNGLEIRVVDPPHFVGTKLEAFKGRGNDDLLGSRDIEDLLNIVDGRESLLNELKTAAYDLRSYAGERLHELLLHSEIGYAVQSTAMGNPAREDLIFDRLERLAALRDS
jgi:hypothetical protein